MTHPAISVEEARAIVLAHCGSAPVTPVPLARAAGSVLRESLYADRDFPPYDRATMDGYALRAEDFQACGARLRVVGFCAAGSPQMVLSEEPGTCIEIGTGAVCPRGADCVIPYEATSREGDSIAAAEEVYPKKGDFLHRQGSDARAGEALVSEGVRLGPREIAIAAAVGKTEFLVSQLPRIAGAPPDSGFQPARPRGGLRRDRTCGADHRAASGRVRCDEDRPRDRARES